MNLRSIIVVAVGLFAVALGQFSVVQAQSPASNSPQAAADVNANIGTAARKGDTVTIMALLKRPGADVNAPALQKKTPLMWAALYGQLKTVEALVGAGARIEEKDSDGATALTYATAGVHPEVVAFLNSKGAKPVPMEKLGGGLWILGQPSDVFDYMGKRAEEAKKK